MATTAGASAAAIRSTSAMVGRAIAGGVSRTRCAAPLVMWVIG